MSRRDARALVRDRAAELGLADRPPDADEQHAVRDDPQEVALEHEIARDDRREHEVQVREDGERRSEAHPAVEVAPVPPVAEREADERDEPQGHEQRRGEPDVRALDRSSVERVPRLTACRAAPRRATSEGGHADADRDE